MFPAFWYLDGADVGKAPPEPTTTVDINASGVNPEPVAWNELVTPHLSDDKPSNANASPKSCLSCWITIPPSPAESEPEASNINLSFTSKFSEFWNDAVPWTVKLPVIISSPVTVNKPVLDKWPPFGSNTNLAFTLAFGAPDEAKVITPFVVAPDKLNKPLDPLDPEEPLVPALPDVPSVPLEPEEPLVPEEPDEPLEPLEPEVPSVPDEAAFSLVPTTPVEDITKVVFSDACSANLNKFKLENEAVVLDEPLNSPSISTKPEPLTDKIGTPEISEAAKTVPNKSSVTEKSWPWVPWISKIVAPLSAESITTFPDSLLLQLQ